MNVRKDISGMKSKSYILGLAFWVKFPADGILKYFFFYFYFYLENRFDIFMKCQILFSGEKKKRKRLSICRLLNLPIALHQAFIVHL